jgi:LPXTG-site transpeptidase (sortase) family protein
MFLFVSENGQASSALAQTGTTTHTITYFQGNKEAAVTFTFDDGEQSQIDNGVSELNLRGLKGTFFIITDDGYINNNVSWATWRSVAAQGHEISSHTETHPHLPGLSEDRVRWEFSESLSALNQNIPGQPHLVLAYPYAESNDAIRSAAADYYVAARGAWVSEGGHLNYYESGRDQYDSWSALNFYNIGSMVGDNADINDPWFNGWLDNAVRRHAWFTILFHGIPDADAFGSILDHVQGRHDYWIDTFGNIVRYMKERLNSTVQVITETNSEIRLQIVMDASLPTSIYNVPLTIRSTVPVFWAQVIVRQGSSIQTFTPVVEGGEKVVYYNALPNGRDIILLDTPYPVPSITNLDPSSAFAGGPTFILTVTGSNFVNGSIVRWNNSDRTTTYVSDTQLTAVIPASDIASTGTANVRVFNPAPGGGTSSQLPFTINLPPAPGIFAKSAPGDGATDQSTNLTLSWGASNSATSYEYCYDTTDDNACSSWTSNGASTSTALSGLSTDTTYYWHVRAVNISGITYSNDSTTAFWSFTTLPDPPDTFDKSIPANGETDQATSRTLNWSASNGATLYEYCYDTINDNACSNWTSNGASTNVTISNLITDTIYYWHVRAINAGGTTYSNGSDSAFWMFTVDNTAPILSSISRADVSPTNLASVDFTVTFSESVTGGGTASFILVTEGNITGASVIGVVGTGSTRTVTVDTGSGDGILGLNMTNGTGIFDTAGNVLDTGNLPFSGEVYTIQKSGPAVAIDAPSNPVTAGGPIDFEINIPGATTINLQSTDVVLNKTGTADATTVDVTGGTTANPRVIISGITGDGTIGISIPTGIATDIIGNPSLAAGPSITFVVDNTAPKIAVDGIGSNAGIIGFDFQVITKDLSQFSIKFDEDAYDPPGDNDPKDVTNPENYLLVRDLGTVPEFQTTGCKSPGVVEPDDTKIVIDNPIIYDSESFTATFTVNDDSPLSNGYYRLYVCGSTSITDLVGTHLAGNGTAGTDFVRSFIVNLQNGGGISGGGNHNRRTDTYLQSVSGLIPTTGFAPNRVTNLPEQPANLAYTTTGEMRLDIPSLNVNVTIVGVKQDDAGWDLTWLGNNAGYLDGTAYPTWAGNTVLTAHVADATNTPGPFAYLKDLNDGDRIYIYVSGLKYIYQVEKNIVVSPHNMSAVFEHEEYDWLTLVTCENYSDLFQRYTSRRVVKAVLVSIIPEK